MSTKTGYQGERKNGSRTQTLLTEELERALPPLYANDGAEDPFAAVVHGKFFNPGGAGTWYLLEGEVTEDGQDYRFFSYVTGLGSDEFGYVVLSELREHVGRFRLGIERDAWWEAAPLSECLVKRL